jgi:hypothetical protein
MTEFEVARQFEEALDFADRGVPSALPDSNRFKSEVEAHRWGRHGDHAGGAAAHPRCPVCARQVAVIT